MFEKFLKSLTKKHDPVLPEQGKRLLLDRESGGDVSFTITGQGRPGFFILFGAMFGGIPAFMFVAILSGLATGDNEAWGEVFGLLFMLPFILIGAATFSVGLFLWFGRTRVLVGSSAVRVERSLFGKIFQQKQFLRSDLDLSFEESHSTNDVPHYKLQLDDGTQKIGIGGSLKEAELLWLNQELRSSLGETPEEVTSVIDEITQKELDSIDHSEIETNYRSSKLQINPTVNGWEARTRSSMIGCLFLALFGSIFFIAGLMMWDTGRNFVFDLFPAIRDAVSGAQSSGSPPVWFAMIFGCTGLFIILLAFFFLGYRSTFALRHSRLFIHRRWLLLSRTRFIDVHDIVDLETQQNGHVNDEPRYRLSAHLKNGKSVKIMGFAARDDVGQLKARLEKAMK